MESYENVIKDSFYKYKTIRQFVKGIGKEEQQYLLCFALVLVYKIKSSSHTTFGATSFSTNHCPATWIQSNYYPKVWDLGQFLFAASQDSLSSRVRKQSLPENSFCSYHHWSLIIRLFSPIYHLSASKPCLSRISIRQAADVLTAAPPQC